MRGVDAGVNDVSHLRGRQCTTGSLQRQVDNALVYAAYKQSLTTRT